MYTVRCVGCRAMMMQDGRKKRAVGSNSGSEADDNGQLSPVAVTDFPCFDDDAGLCSPPLDDSLLSRVQGKDSSQSYSKRVAVQYVFIQEQFTHEAGEYVNINANI
jgi:hypothetical protein